MLISESRFPTLGVNYVWLQLELPCPRSQGEVQGIAILVRFSRMGDKQQDKQYWKKTNFDICVQDCFKTWANIFTVSQLVPTLVWRCMHAYCPCKVWV